MILTPPTIITLVIITGLLVLQMAQVISTKVQVAASITVTVIHLIVLFT